MRLRDVLDRRRGPAPASPDEQRPPLDASLPPGVKRQISIDDRAKFRSYVEYQALYMDHATGRLIPNTEVLRGGKLEIQVNALGCKGPDLPPGMPVIAFFGDSATMGVELDSWPFHVHIPGYAILNAAIEGLSLAPMVRRFDELADLAPIACAVVCAGWHNLLYNDASDEFWRSHLERFLGDHVTAYWTVPTCLTDEFRTRDYSRLMNSDPGATIDDDYFNFWMDMDAASTIGPLLDAIDRYNDFVKQFAEEHDAVVIDLHDFLRPPSYADAPRDFFDVCHLRPRAYEKVGEFVEARLREVLPPPGDAVTTVPPRELQRREAEDLRKNMYRLW
jgi:GDSL-like Lipase/Acylhydrolase family